MSAYKIEAGTGQHIGDRSEQQDCIALLAGARAPGYMMAVLADGMGGAGGGRIAAEQAIRTAQQVFSQFSPLAEDVETMLRAIVSELHTVISLMTLASAMRPQTTIAMLVLSPEKTAIWGHVGDSRIYRFAGPDLAERTNEDRTVAAAGAQTAGAPAAPAVSAVPAVPAVHAVSATPAPRQTAMPPNVIGNPGAPPALILGRHAGLQVGDAFLLCSDGLWQHGDESRFGAVIAMNSPREASQLLIQQARAHAVGGDADNCTLGIVKLVMPPKQVVNYQVGKMDRAV